MSAPSGSVMSIHPASFYIFHIFFSLLHAKNHEQIRSPIKVTECNKGCICKLHREKHTEARQIQLSIILANIALAAGQSDLTRTNRKEGSHITLFAGHLSLQRENQPPSLQQKLS